MAQAAIVCVVLLAALGAVVDGQQFCQSLTSMAGVNYSQLVGTWYEVARAPASQAGCVQVNMGLINNNTQLNVTTTYSSSNSSTWMNMTVNHMISLAPVQVGGSAPAITYKILNTDYENYLVVCGYTSSNTSTSFGAILTSSNRLNFTLLSGLISNTSTVLSNFNSTTVGYVNQKNCHTTSGAALMAPYLASVLAALMLASKLFH